MPQRTKELDLVSPLEKDKFEAFFMDSLKVWMPQTLCHNDFYSSDDKSFSDEHVPKGNFKFFSNPLSDEEISSTKIYPHHFNAEFDLIESLLNRDISIVFSPKFDSLLEEFSSELAHIDLIPPGINEADFDPEEEIRLDSFVEDIDLFLTPDDSMPPGIENDNYDSEGNIIFLEKLLSNDSPSLHENESILISTFFDCPDFEASRARGFVLRSLELQILSFIMGIQYPNLID
ncbi:hypothetical protein Tco_0509644 [Tanacetum coccineum]